MGSGHDNLVLDRLAPKLLYLLHQEIDLWQAAQLWHSFEESS